MHGIHTTEQESGLTLQDAETNIVTALVTVPTFLLDSDQITLNKPVPIRNYSDLAKYAGKNSDNFTAYDTIDTILKESEGATVYMINVFDAAKHKTNTTETEVTLTAGKYVIDKAGVSDLVVKKDSTVGVEGTDYKLTLNTDNSVIEILDGAFSKAAVTSIKISYSYADLSKITSADFVGAIDEDNIKTGAKVIYNINALYGDEVNIIIAPVYSSLPAVRQELINIADDLKARVFLDAPIGTSVNTAVAGRINGGDVDLLCSSQNATLCMPWFYRYNQETDKNILRPASPALAGARVYLNKNRNVAKSLDNTKLKTCLGLEYPVEFILNKENTEANALNNKGIVTIINYKGTWRIWGGRNCAYPSETGIKTFDSPRDVANFIEKTIENGSFECIGENPTKAFIDNILETIKAKFNEWKNPEDQIIYDGDIWYDESLNTAELVANGKLRLQYKFCPLAVVEDLEYYSYVDVDYITTALSSNN